MFINFEVLNKKRLTPLKVFILIALKQKNFDYLKETYWLEEKHSLIEEDYITTLKGKSPDNSENLRLSTKGKKVLEELETPPLSEDIIKVAEWLKNHYKKIGKDVGNFKRTQRHIRDFSAQTGIIKNNLVILCLDFLRENEENSNMLEYVWYKPKTVFATKFDLEDSWIYRHYQKNQKRLEAKFEEY